MNGDDTTIKLIFCHPQLDVEAVTRALGQEPTHTLEVGQMYAVNAVTRRPSPVTLWELTRGRAVDATDEEYLENWWYFLEERREAVAALRERGYDGYLDCKLGGRGLFIDPALLEGIGKLGIGIGAWRLKAQPQRKGLFARVFGWLNG